MAEPTELSHVLLFASGMCGYEVISQIVILIASSGTFIESLFELYQLLRTGLPHSIQNLPADMFRSDLHLSGNVMGDQFLKISVA